MTTQTRRPQRSKSTTSPARRRAQRGFHIAITFARKDGLDLSIESKGLSLHINISIKLLLALLPLLSGGAGWAIGRALGMV